MRQGLGKGRYSERWRPAGEAKRKGVKSLRRSSRCLPAVMLGVAALSSAGCGSGSSTAVHDTTAISSAAASTRQTPPASSATASNRTTTSTTFASQRPVRHGPFLASANAICARLTSEFEAERPKSDGLAEVAHVALRRAAAEEAALAELRELTPLVSLARAWERIVAVRQDRIENLRGLATYAEAADAKDASSAVAAGEGIRKQLRTLAAAAGAAACAEVG